MINAIGIPLLHNCSSFTERILAGYDTIHERNDALLKASYLYNVNAFLYDFSDINEYLQTGKLLAFYWDGDAYRKCYTDIPKYTEIYCGLTKMRRVHPKEMEWLVKNTIITDDLGLGKFELQRKLLLSDLSQYAIPTLSVNSYVKLLSFAPMFPVSFLKPAGGRKAKGAMRLEYNAGKLLYSTPESSGVLSAEIFQKYYSDAGYHEGSRLLLEPCLNILNDEGRAVDFRCLVSLNGEGKWQNVLTYARIGGSGVASNFSHGGSLNFAEDVLEMLIPGHGAEKLEEINHVALQVAEFVQKESRNPVSWLGLDICVDRPSNQVFVIEANSKPGTKLVGPWPLSLVRAQYFKYLLSQTDKEK